MTSLEKMREELTHCIVHKVTLHEPKGYGTTKTSGFTAALVPEWQLRRWHQVAMQPVHSAPFSSYPEDRAKLLELARKCEQSDDVDAVELGDLVRSILEDEAVSA